MKKVLRALIVICVLMTFSTTCFAWYTQNGYTTVDSRLVDWYDYNSILAGDWSHVEQQYCEEDISWITAGSSGGGYASTKETYSTVNSNYWWRYRRKVEVIYTYTNPDYGALPKSNEVVYHSWGNESSF